MTEQLQVIKKFAAMALCLSMVGAGMTVHAGGPSGIVDINAEIQRALAGISDVDVSTISDDAIKAELIDENGNITELDTYITIREVSKARSGATQYAMTVVARASDKATTGSETPSNSDIDVTANGTLYWTDNFGNDNVITAVSASWDALSGSSTSNRSVYASAGKFAYESKRWENISNSFSANCNLTGEKVSMDTYADVKNSSGDTERLHLSIAPAF